MQIDAQLVQPPCISAVTGIGRHRFSSVEDSVGVAYEVLNDLVPRVCRRLAVGDAHAAMMERGFLGANPLGGWEIKALRRHVVHKHGPS